MDTVANKPWRNYGKVGFCNITPEVIPRNATGSKVWPFGKIKFTVGNSILRLLQQQQFAQIQQHSPHFKISEYKHDFNQNPPKKNHLSAALSQRIQQEGFHNKDLLQTWNTMSMSVLSWSLSSRNIQQILVIHISVIILMTYVVLKQRSRSRGPRPSAVKLRFGKLMSDLYCRDPKEKTQKPQETSSRIRNLFLKLELALNPNSLVACRKAL